MDSDPTSARKSRRSRTPPRTAGLDALPAAGSALARERLLDLAYDVSSYLRHHSQPAVRISAALLLAASLASCSGEESPDDSGEPPETVAPLTQEVRQGVPTAPGRYDVVDRSIRRDPQGVYHFLWRDPGDTSGADHSASISLLKLGETTSAPYLEVPSSGDPILHLGRDTQVALSSTEYRQTSGGYFGPSFVYWRPFYVGTGYYPGYYDPPIRTVPSSGTVDGSNVSTAPRPAAERTVGLSRAVSGRAGGTGSGTAASNRAGADVSSGKSSVSSGSSSFSGGKSSASSGSSGGGSSASSS
jgi:hypothetical protein